MVARVPLFSTLDAAAVAEVIKLLYTRTFQPDALIVSAGEPGGAMYLIGGGEATVCVVPGRSPTHLVAFMCWTARGFPVSAAGTPKSSVT
jgi:hypothetical protein